MALLTMSRPSIHDLKIDRSIEPPATPKWWLFAGALILLLGVGVYLGFFRGDGALPVDTIRVASGKAVGSSGTVLNATGYVVARRSATVSSKVSGRIEEILVEEGDEVGDGAVLARLDPSNVKAALGLAEAQLAASKAAIGETSARLREAGLELQRIERLAQQGIASQSDLDSAQAAERSLTARIERLEAEVKVAASQVVLRRQDLQDLEIRAPFPGVVISKDAQPGEMISPVSAGGGFTRTGICTLVDMQSLEIEVDVNEAFINRVKTGQKVTAVLDAYTADRLPASVIAIVPSADRQKATVKVRIGFDRLEERILPEMGVKVSFQETGAEAIPTGGRQLRIPLECLSEEGEKAYVWVVDDGVVERRAIGVGAKSANDVVVRSGLRSGEVLVVNPPDKLEDGSLVVMNDEL